MKRLAPIFFLTVLIVLALPPILKAQGNPQPDTKIGDFIFKMPAGWKSAQSGKIVLLVAPSAPPGTTTTILLETFALNNRLQTSFNSLWSDFQKPFHTLQTGQTQQTQQNGYSGFYTLSLLSDTQGTKWATIFLVAQNGQHAEQIVYMTDSAQSQPANTEAVKTFLSSLRFTKVQPVASKSGTSKYTPAPASGGFVGNLNTAGIVPTSAGDLSGVYRAMAKPGEDPTVSLQSFDPAQRTPKYQFLMVFPDGRVKRGLITSGMDSYIDESQMRLDVANGGKMAAQWGIGQFSGDQGRIIFASNSGGVTGDIWQVSESSDKLDVNGQTYRRLDSGAGLDLEGTYKPFGDKSQPGITFKSDGEFIDQGILHSKMSTNLALGGGGVVMDYGFSSPGPGRGTYHISSYSLHLEYTNSQSPSALFFLDPGTSGTKPPALYINNVKFERVN